MGYAYYEIPRPNQPHGQTMKRGYGVSCKCHQWGCRQRIDRGIGYLCYGCTWYFCGEHLFYTDTALECFAGESKQACLKCAEQKSNDE